MIIKTYQSKSVLMTLRNGQVHRARRNLRFEAPYSALADLFQMHCQSPVFGYVKGCRFCTDGKVSDSVLLTLDVPDDRVRLTEYNVWADYMDCVLHYTRPGHRGQVLPNEEVSQRQFNQMRQDLLDQRPLQAYQIPQAVLEEIRPEWLVKVEKDESLLSRLVNRLRVPGFLRGV